VWSSRRVACQDALEEYREVKLVRGVGLTLVGMGLFILYFLFYELVGTSGTVSRDQAALRRSLERQWASQPAPTGPGRTSGRPVQAVRPIPNGRPLALLEIPKIGLQRVLLEGADRDDLRKGPGHISTTALPGQPGTVGVAGHRTTSGAPFCRLDELAKGDRVVIMTQATVFTYTVRRTAIMRPSDTEVLDDVRGSAGKPSSTISLVTCDPRYSARQRLVVFGELTSTVPKDKAASLAA
jgi:sortase A